MPAAGADLRDAFASVLAQHCLITPRDYARKHGIPGMPRSRRHDRRSSAAKRATAVPGRSSPAERTSSRQPSCAGLDNAPHAPPAATLPHAATTGKSRTRGNRQQRRPPSPRQQRMTCPLHPVADKDQQQTARPANTKFCACYVSGAVHSQERCHAHGVGDRCVL